LLLGVLLACATAVGVADARRGTLAPAKGEGVSEARSGLVFRLSEGTDEGAAPALVARPPAERLADAEARRVLDRLPPFAAEPREEPFALREASLPPPRTGRTVRDAFPPPAEAPRPGEAPAGPLEVLRRMPEGDVPLAPHLSVTFSQPMVALDAHEALSRAGVPVRLSPQPPGEWRWVGTRTLVFEPEGRFPMATGYRVEVPAGTRRATGRTACSGRPSRTRGGRCGTGRTFGSATPAVRR
jgi:hypothetical protein